MFRCLMVFVFLTSSAYADGERAGEFDYYVMSLSWTPTWCELQGDRRKSPQCDTGRGFGFTLHGLWPQYTDGGWPEFCKTHYRSPSRAMTSNMVDIMGSTGLAWHQWKKHGRCTGLSATDYYALSREAYAKINRPLIFRKLEDKIDLPAAVVEEAFMEANPELLQNQITITCKSHKIQEVRICMTKDLELTKCGQGLIKDCSLKNAGFSAIR